ncbi:MAG: nucleotidyl transferase AbiEii/AbiGii toxin family protein [Desulfoferrobacter sp.]
MNGFWDSFAEQLSALEAAFVNILRRIPLEAWSFGGGTALALFYLQHRRSYDVDIFVHDPQYFSFLSPKWFIDDQTVFQSDYLEQADHISLATLTGVKVDLLLAPNLTDEPSSLRKVGRVKCYVESLEEIIAKKIRYRRTQAKTRDIVDIGVAITQFPEILTGLVNQNTVTLDELFEWRKTLSGLNRSRYLQELAIIEPTASYRDSCEGSPEAIIANIDAVKFDIVNSKS